MSKDAYVNVRTDHALKEEAEAILKTLGLTPSDAINMFYNQIKLHNGLPFEVKIPNSVTVKAINDLENNIDVTEYNSVEDYFKKKKRPKK